MDILADEDDWLVTLEPALDPPEDLHQGLPPGLGVDLRAGRLGTGAEQHPEDLKRGARLTRAFLVEVRGFGPRWRGGSGRCRLGVNQRHRAEQATLDLVGLGVLGETEHVASEIGDHSVRRHRGADARARTHDDRLARRDVLEERSDEGSLADAGVADDRESVASGA